MSSHETTQIYQAINAVNLRLNDIASRLDTYTNARVNEITPYSETKTVYFGETSKNFYNIPQGNLTVFWDGDYTVQRLDDEVTISFTPLTEAEATISIMVQ